MPKYNEDDFTMSHATHPEPSKFEMEPEDADFEDVDEEIPEDAELAISEKSKILFMNKVTIEQFGLEVAKIEKINRGLEKDISTLLENFDIEQFKTEFGSHTRKEHMYAKVDDWDKFYEYVVKTGATEFLPKSVNINPFRAMLKKDHKVPPGLSPSPQMKTISKINPTFKSEQLAKLNKEK